MKKPITIKIPKCKKCKGKLEPRFTTELDEKSKEKPEIIIVMGVCEKCNIIYVLNLIKTKDLPQSFKELKDFVKLGEKVK